MTRHFISNLTALHRSGCPSPTAHFPSVGDGELVLEDGELVDVRLQAPDGLVRLDPGESPVDDATRTLPPAAMNASLVAVAGAGAGYAVDALLGLGYRGRIVVLEPSPVSYVAALSRRDWTAPITAGRLRWLVGPDYNGWLDTWSWVTPGEPPAVVIHPVLGRVRPTDVRSALETLKKMVFNASANERARVQFGARYLRHTLTNLSHLLASRDVGQLFGRFSGVPVVVLAAGPSLDVNLEQLRPVRERALVIAVDTALRPCLAAGLAPDLVVGVDPGEVNLRHLAVGDAPATTHLVTEASLAPGSFEPFGGRVFTFRVGDHAPWPWLQAQGIERAPLRAWGSVLASALDLAVRIGGNPIVLLGADFAYTGGQPYCRNTAYEEDWARDQAAGHSLEVIWRQWIKAATETSDLSGQPVKTTPHLIAFRDWIANYCRTAPNVTFVNGTGAGLLGSIAQAPVGEVLAGSPVIDRQAILADGRDRGSARLPDSLAWWDGRTPPQPWVSWASSTENAVGDLLAASGAMMPAETLVSIARAAGVLRGLRDSPAETRAEAEGAYWAASHAASPSQRVAAARRLVLGPVDPLSESFYSAVCVLLDRDVPLATATLTEALNGDFNRTFRLLLPLLAHARQREGDMRTAHLLFAASERLDLLSGRNAWARVAAREATHARALHLAARKTHGGLPRAEYDALAASVRAASASDEADGPLRRPDFIVAGAGGCGAVLLYDFIGTSPTVWARRPKELRFFSHLTELDLPFYSRFFRDCPDGMACGDVSASYLDGSNGELAPLDDQDPASVIAATCPATRVIVIVRDPAMRALELYARQAGHAELSLEQLRARYGDRPLVTGNYVLPLRRFESQLGRDRMLVVSVAELAEADGLAARLAAFLRIARPDSALLPALERARLLHGPIAGSLYDQLRQYYAPSLQALKTEFGVSL